MGYRCINHPESQAELLITMLSDGNSVELCGACIHPWASAMAASTDPASFAAAVEAEAAGDLGDDDPAPYSVVDLGTLTDEQLATAGLTRAEVEAVAAAGGILPDPVEVDGQAEAEAEPATQTAETPA